MMSYKRYICVMVCLATLLVVVAQTPTEKPKPSSPLFAGISAHVDIASPIMGVAIDPSLITAQAVMDVNLLNRYFPVFEIGYASINSLAGNGSIYQAQAPFGRIGMNLNLLKADDKKGNPRSVRSYPYVGVRYGMSVVKYNLSNVPYPQNYWTETQLVDFSGKNAYAGWAEVVAGVRLDMFKGFTMGWSVRINLLLHSSLDNKSFLWYVPGYGNSSGTTFAFNYTLGYTYYSKAERARLNK